MGRVANPRKPASGVTAGSRADKCAGHGRDQHGEAGAAAEEWDSPGADDVHHQGLGGEGLDEPAAAELAVAGVEDALRCTARSPPRKAAPAPPPRSPRPTRSSGRNTPSTSRVAVAIMPASTHQACRPAPPPSRPSRARDSCRSEIARRLVLPLWCRDTSPQFVWWHHDLHARRSKVKSPTMRPTGRGVTSSCRDGKTGREIHEHALSNQ
jgi:hypothetical protein